MEAARKLSLVRDDSPAQPIETFTAPTVLFRCKQPAVAWLYAWLYDQTLAAGRETCDTSVAAIMEAFERDRRTVDGWLTALAGEPWNAVRVEEDALTGQMRVTVYALRPFAPRRAAKCEPQRPLLPDEASRALDSSVSPIEETRGAVIAPTSHVDRAACGTSAAPREVRDSRAGGICANSPANSPGAAGDFAQKPPGEFVQTPPDDAAALARLIEAKRAQQVRPPPPQVLEAPGDFAQIPPPRSIDLRSSDKRNTKRSQIYAQSPPASQRFGADPAGARRFEADLIAELQGRVAGLYGAPARKVAKAVAAGWLDWHDVQRAIDRGDQLVAAGQCPRTLVYFVGAMRTQFAQHGQMWSRPKPR